MLATFVIENNDWLEKGEEWIFFSGQMMIDVYHYEGDPLPEKREMTDKWLTRPGEQSFWVYRASEPVEVFRTDWLFAARAKTAHLNASPKPDFQRYYHVPTICLAGGFRLNMKTGSESEDRQAFWDLRERILNY